MMTLQRLYQVRLIRASLLATVLVAAGGCATSSDLDSIRAMAEQAQADASAARQTAEEARATANQAMQMSQATDERLNRMFRRSMQK